MFESNPNETMSSSQSSPGDLQLTKVRELDLDSPNRSRNNRKYKEVREREYLYEHEVEAMLKAAKTVVRHGHRDATLILLAYRHGLRVTELVNLRWQQVNLKTGHIHINRLKGSRPSSLLPTPYPPLAIHQSADLLVGQLVIPVVSLNHVPTG